VCVCVCACACACVCVYIYSIVYVCVCVCTFIVCVFNHSDMCYRGFWFLCACSIILICVSGVFGYIFKLLTQEHFQCVFLFD